MECSEPTVRVGPARGETRGLGNKEWMPAQSRRPFNHGQLDPAASVPWGPPDEDKEKPKTEG